MPFPRIAILVDLPRETGSGGHVKYWERIAQAARAQDLPVDVTLYFSGSGADEMLSPQLRYRYLPPVFSSEKLKFLPYVPAHTDLAPFHGKLAEELTGYDVIHTTDAYFAFARTAERIARWHKIPLVNSFHTDTPAYAELFTRVTLHGLFGKKIGDGLAHLFKLPQRARASKEKRLKKHLQVCDVVLAMRGEDIDLARQTVAAAQIKPMHLGVDKELFAPTKLDRAGVERDFGIAAGTFIILFVGRVDAGKNAGVLIQACADAIAQGANLHLVIAGVGPLCAEAAAKLGTHATLAGLVEPSKLARLYASVDCLAMTSDVEIGGMAGLEALAACCPVLVSRQSGVAQLCDNTPAMQMVESGVAAWTTALGELSRDAARLSRMRDAAFVYRRDHLRSWGDVLTQDFIPVWESFSQRKA